MADETPVKRKEHEPITMVFGIVLLVAIVLAIGIHINDHVLNNDDAVVTDSSTVTVNYSGSLYGYYDEGGALFQTTLKNIDENTGYKHIASYTYNDSTLEVDMSSWSGVQAFRDCLLGHKVGDTVRVKAPADAAYVAPETYNVYALTSVTTTNNFYVSSLSDIPDMGWTYNWSFDDAKNMYLVSYTMSNTDECTSKVDTDFATVTTTNFKYSGDKMTYDVSIKAISVPGSSIEINNVAYQEVQGFHLVIDGKSTLVTAVQNISSEGVVSGAFVTKQTSQITNEALYFVITITAIE